MSLHLTFLLAYSIGLMALGLAIGRRVRASADFFVASRQLGPGLIFATMLAANIGAGSTVGATSRGYSEGLAAWWWVGSAAIGSVVLAFWIGPAMRREAAAHNLATVGDYLEHRYNKTLRVTIAVLLWLGSIFILASQLIGLGWILNVVTGIPKPIGSAAGGLLITVYFAAGGLLTSAKVNTVQLAVKLIGFAVALPLAIHAFGGWTEVATVEAASPNYWSFWRADISLSYFALVAPAFVVSPGLLQKIFGARDDRAVRVGVGLNALGLFLFAGVPAVLGIVARGNYPTLDANNLALPMILMHTLPPLIGALALAAVFSAEVSAADASLFMLTTSLSQDLYKRFIRPDADDRRVLRVARWTALTAGILGVLLAWTTEDVIDTLTVFYALISVGLFVPIVGGLYVQRTSATGALLSVACGVTTTLAVQVMTRGAGIGLVTPPLAGLSVALGVWLISLLLVPARTRIV
ncbi:MAG: sodium:solute symporter family protein [Acidobacteriaceae bacterium]|nr:sodium:solute symporter family protein [Acidobacteriaceae bacterium]